MSEIFKAVIMLSAFGSVMILILLLLKPFMSRKATAQWQIWIWISVFVFMILPVYKFIPKQKAEKISFISIEKDTPAYKLQYEQKTLNDVMPTVNEYPTSPPNLPEHRVSKEITPLNFTKILPHLWFFGMCTYVLITVFIYVKYCVKKYRCSFEIPDNIVFNEMLSFLGIRRKITLRVSNHIKSPMLVGVIFPTVYIPLKDISDSNLRMIFLHELCHYKRRDLIVKWFAMFVNAIHWFNPFVYIACANLSESCETACDLQVTSSMTEQDKKIYMKTILDFAREEM